MPAPGEIEFLERAAQPGQYPFGALSPADIFFLSAVASILAPSLIIEIGTASGLSSALLAAAIARRFRERGEQIPETIIHTIDRKDDCLFDATKPIGFGVPLVVGDLAKHVKIHTPKDSFFAPQLAKPRSLTLAFIDANHQHPWPLIDVLNLLPLMVDEAWILMHDIRLPKIAAASRAQGREVPVEARAGAQYVFDYWPDSKIDGGNVGAIRVPKDRSALRNFIATLLHQPFETSESGWKKYRKMVEELAERNLNER
jgi:cephalosporin hydroxylase